MDIQNNSIVTDADTEVLDSQITQISNDFAENYYLDNEQEEELELLIAKAMKLGELYERKKWQAAKAQAVPEENALLSATLDAVQKLGGGEFVLVEREKLAMIFETATNALVYHAAPPKHDALSIIQGIARKAMIEAQEST